MVADSIVETRCFYIKPAPNYYEPINIRIHGITEKLTDSAPSFGELWQAELSDYVQNYPLVAHNASFEKSVFNALNDCFDIEVPEQIHDTVRLSPDLLSGIAELPLGQCMRIF